MKTNLSKTEAKEKIDNFFLRKEFDKEEIRRIKRLAMKFKIRLKDKRKLFCKACKSPLKGKMRLSRTHKTIICEECKFRNKFKHN
jgi:RNase P subunit RPR2